MAKLTEKQRHRKFFGNICPKGHKLSADRIFCPTCLGAEMAKEVAKKVNLEIFWNKADK